MYQSVFHVSVCRDKYGGCKNVFVKRNWCKTRVEYSKYWCKKTCGFCESKYFSRQDSPDTNHRTKVSLRTKAFVIHANFREICPNTAWLCYWHIGQKSRLTKVSSPRQICVPSLGDFISNKVCGFVGVTIIEGDIILWIICGEHFLLKFSLNFALKEAKNSGSYISLFF